VQCEEMGGGMMTGGKKDILDCQNDLEGLVYV
jgi:hypothetical protein